MDIDEFQQSLTGERPPRGLNAPLRALWHDARGDWKRAHEIVQEEEGSKDGNRVHAYLHRKEGDLSNADYWYTRSGTKRPAGTLEKEWEGLARQLLKDEG